MLDVQVNEAALTAFAQRLAATVEIPLGGSEPVAARTVVEQYRRVAGIEVDLEVARRMVRVARDRVR